MGEQFRDMRTDYTEQLDQIEKAFLRERNDIISRNDEEIKELFKQHKKLEDECMARRSQDSEYYTNQLE